MKKLILLFVAVLFAANVSAERGNMMLGGNISFYSRSELDLSPGISEFRIAPSFQYFITDRISLGTQIGFQTVQFDSDRANRISVDVFGRHHFARVQVLGTHLISVFGQANIGAGFANNELWFGNSSIYAGIAPGIQFLIPFSNMRWSVETLFNPILNFESQRFDNGTRNSFRAGVNTGTRLSFAVNYHF